MRRIACFIDLQCVLLIIAVLTWSSERQVTPFLGNSTFANEMRNLINVVSENDASVLLKGERGTGKRLFAQSVHYTSSGSLDGFFEINCKTLKLKTEDGFISSEVEKVFEKIRAYSSGNYKITLFINFIELMDLDSQNLLLNFMKECQEKNICMKVICSSEKNTDELLQNAKDLYYQISNVVLSFTPLRQRKEDIIPISEYYFSKFKKLSGNPFDKISQSALELLTEYYWKGNIDELINCFQRAFIVGEVPMIKAEDFGITFNSVQNISENSFDDVMSENGMSLKDAVDSFKKYYVTKVLSENNWNQTKSAKILGIQRTYVIRLMNELQIRK